MAAEAVISSTVKRALTPQKGGFLASGFTHTLNPYMGCAFGRMGCPFCYVRESPVGQFGPAPWGTWVRQKGNIAEVLEQELRPPAARHYRVFMSSATDPYQPAEASGMSDAALFDSAALPIPSTGSWCRRARCWYSAILLCSPHCRLSR